MVGWCAAAVTEVVAICGGGLAGRVAMVVNYIDLRGFEGFD